MPARGVRLIPRPAVHFEIDKLALLERRFHPQRCIRPVYAGNYPGHSLFDEERRGPFAARSLGHATSRALPPRTAAGNPLHLS